MKNFFQLLVTLTIVSLLPGCGGDSQIMHTNITGKASELVVVISKESWEGVPGKIIRQTMAQPQLGLPQDEPLFDVIDVPHAGFKSIFKTTRNIIQTSISPNVQKEGIAFTDDVWAYPQATVQIKAKNAESFELLFNENKARILSYFIAAEKERLAMNYNKFYDKGAFNVLDKYFGLKMKVAPGFQVAEQEKNFVWLKYETPEISQGIFLYTIPYQSDSTFTLNYLLPVQDQIMRKYIPGPTKGSYMATEKRFDQLFQVASHNGNYAAEIRGLWRLENDFMGGPFITLAELDASNQRVVLATGYVYAPSKDKRNLLRQLEAMIYSLEMNDQAKNDKIQQQLNMETEVKGELN